MNTFVNIVSYTVKVNYYIASALKDFFLFLNIVYYIKYTTNVLSKKYL